MTLGDDPRAIVAAGYDAIADTYASWGLGAKDPIKQRFVQLAIELVRPDAKALDLGCGTGEHVSAALAAHFEVTGVDISPQSIALARQRTPGPAFVVGDMTTLDFTEASFALVVAFYSMIHVPREHHAGLLQSICRFLEPGGLLIATMGATSEVSFAENWLGAPMYWSHFGAEINLELVEAAGLEVESSELITATENNDVVMHQWIVARRPLADLLLDCLKKCV